MKKTGRVLVIVLVLMVAIGWSAAICTAQPDEVKEPASKATKEAAPAKTPAKAEGSKAMKPAASTPLETKTRLVVKGKIIKVGANYYLRGENPPEELMIVNPNVKKLDSLIKKGKVVQLEGHSTVSADRLYVEKINGKKYRGDGNANVE